MFKLQWVESMKNKLFSLLLLVLSFVSGYYVGSHEFYMAADCDRNGNISVTYPHCFNLKDAYYGEREYCSAWIELAHHYLYDWNPSICGECDSLLDAYHNTDYWTDVVSESCYYDKIDSLNGGEWEDFYTFWR